MKKDSFFMILWGSIVLGGCSSDEMMDGLDSNTW